MKILILITIFLLTLSTSFSDKGSIFIKVNYDGKVACHFSLVIKSEDDILLKRESKTGELRIQDLTVGRYMIQIKSKNCIYEEYFMVTSDNISIRNVNLYSIKKLSKLNRKGKSVNCDCQHCLDDIHKIDVIVPFKETRKM